MNRLIKFPAVYEPQPGDGPVIYVAGDIHREDWQTNSAAPRLMASTLPVVVIPSGRAERPMKVGLDSQARMIWGAAHLSLDDAVVMVWFPDSPDVDHTLTWMDLILALTDGRNVIAGCHPKYRRANDLRLYWQQYRGARFPLYDNLAWTVDAALERANLLRTKLQNTKERGVTS